VRGIADTMQAGMVRVVARDETPPNGSGKEPRAGDNRVVHHCRRPHWRCDVLLRRRFWGFGSSSPAGFAASTPVPSPAGRSRPKTSAGHHRKLPAKRAQVRPADVPAADPKRSRDSSRAERRRSHMDVTHRCTPSCAVQPPLSRSAHDGAQGNAHPASSSRHKQRPGSHP